MIWRPGLRRLPSTGVGCAGLTSVAGGPTGRTMLVPVAAVVVLSSREMVARSCSSATTGALLSVFPIFRQVRRVLFRAARLLWCLRALLGQRCWWRLQLLRLVARLLLGRLLRLMVQMRLLGAPVGPGQRSKR